MKSSAGLAGHLVAERSRICASGVASSSASQRTPFGYDLIQGTDMNESFRLADTSCDRSMIVAIRPVGKRVSPQDDIALRRDGAAVLRVSQQQGMVVCRLVRP